MNHPAELALHQYMENAASGKSTMSSETIQQVSLDVAAALGRQFGGGNKRDKFGLRMSNVGRPTCQLWFEKNKPEEALPLPTTFVMNMMLGDIVEAVFKGLLKEAGVKYEDDEKVTLDLDDDTSVSGTYDIVIDGAVDDIKSASNWSYTNKFDSFETLKESDGFGYVAQDPVLSTALVALFVVGAVFVTGWVLTEYGRWKRERGEEEAQQGLY